MKKIIFILLISVVLMVGCSQDHVTLSKNIEKRVITTGEIVNLNEVDGEYKVTIGEEDQENKCIWINTFSITKEEYENLKIGQIYTKKD